MADLSSAQRNAINLKMRQQPWYQAFFRAKGLNPNQVQLSDADRQQLTQLAAANGMPLPDGALIDKAGNVNIQHGFAGLPTWAKIAVGAAPVAAAMLVPGVREATIGNIGSIFGIGGSHAAPAFASVAPSAAATGAGAATTITPIAASMGAPAALEASILTPTLAGAGPATYGFAGAAPSLFAAGHAAVPTVGSALGLTSAAGLTTRDIVKSALTPGIQAATGLWTAHSQGKQADRALTAELAAQDRAATLQAKSAADQLEFLKKSEADRLAEARRVEGLNLGLFNEREGRLNPYRQLGLNALARFGQPISVGGALGI